MKKITLVAVLLFGLTLTGLSQTIVIETEPYNSGRIALPNPSKDTLYVVKPMVNLFTTIWDDPSYKNERPTIVSVETIDPYALKMGLGIKSEMKQ